MQDHYSPDQVALYYYIGKRDECKAMELQAKLNAALVTDILFKKLG